MQNAFKDYIGSLVLHKSTVSGMHLRDDPTILGWELTNSAVCPGDDSGNTVQARAATLSGRGATSCPHEVPSMSSAPA